MAAEATSRPAYTSGLVAAILFNWPVLASDGWPGRLPMQKWALATRGGKRRGGPASFENPAVYRSDVEPALPRLDPQTRRVVELRMQGCTVRTLGRKLDRSYSTATRYLDRAIGELTDLLNGGDMATTPKPNGKPSINGAQQTEELERLQQAICRKLLALPPGWEQVVVKKGMAESFVVKVVY